MPKTMRVPADLKIKPATPIRYTKITFICYSEVTEDYASKDLKRGCKN